MDTLQYAGRFHTCCTHAQGLPGGNPWLMSQLDPFKCWWKAKCAHVSLRWCSLVIIHAWGQMEGGDASLQGNVNSWIAFAPGFSVWKIASSSSNYMGIWPVCLHLSTVLCCSANVAFCLCNLQKCVSVASKLTALQNYVHLNKHHCPAFISPSVPQFPLCLVNIQWVD